MSRVQAEKPESERKLKGLTSLQILCRTSRVSFHGRSGIILALLLTQDKYYIARRLVS